MNKTPFPEWPRPSSDELILIAELIAKYTKFLNPEIVQKVVESNEKQNANWCNLLKIKKINHELYLWEKCATAFPGVRRHIGQKEIHNVKNQKRHIPLLGEAVEIDDNDYPKEIWSFILSGNKFRKKGPTGYELAHLADHKEHNNRCAKEFVVKDIKHSITYFGLFTCPTNTVYIPSALLRPTDFSISLRLLLLRRSNQLYGRFCKILPPAYDLPELHKPEWDINKFEWADPVGDVSNVDSFLLYRQGKLDKMLRTTA